MNKIIIVAALVLSASVTALASSDTYRLADDYCQNVSQMGLNAYLSRISKRPKSKQFLLDQVMSIPGVGREMSFAINYGYDQAKDRNDASVTSWGYCMSQRLD